MFMETDTARERLERFCRGTGLDVGFGGSAIVPTAICLDREEGNGGRAVNPDSSPTHIVGEADNLRWFRDGVLDYVFSSHCLEDFWDIKKVLCEWLRVIKPGGYLVLFLPDEQVYRSVTPDNIRNQAHKHENFGLDFVKKALFDLGYGESDIAHQLWPVPNNYYSFDLVVQKPVSIQAKDDNQPEAPPVRPPAVLRTLNGSSYENRRIVQMGRYGDIINILPIARDISKRTGKPVPVVCKREYADILDGVSYAVAEVCDSPPPKDPSVLDTHAAHPISQRRVPYNLQAWEQVGYADRFMSLFPVFDMRCRVREIELVESLVTFTKPVMLLALNGLSSPMPEKVRDQVRKRVRESFDRRFQVIELNQKVYRPYDLLGLMDVAAVVLTIDTMILHLATATDIPVVAMLSSHPPVFWRASATKGNVVCSMTYDKVLYQWDQIVRSVDAHTRYPWTAPNPIIHVVPTYRPASDEEQRRLRVAENSWDDFHRLGATFVEFTEADAPRVLAMENRRLPYLKDALELALSRAGSNQDVICFTNSDTVLDQGFWFALQHRMASSDYCCSFRMEYEKAESEKDVRCGYRTFGRDMFAFKRGWLADHLDEIPDFLLGVGGWDYALAMWFRILSGRTAESCDPSVLMPDIEMGYGFVWHERHDSDWYTKTDQEYLKPAGHNRQCLAEFMTRLGLTEAHKDIK